MAAELSLFDSLYRAFWAFQLQMEFCTEPTSDGGRRVVGISGAECVSNAADTLHTRLAFANTRIATSGIGNDAVLIKTLSDAEAALASARGNSACRETDSVVEMLQRYRDGDLLGSSLLEALDSARQQLEPYAQQGKAKWSDLFAGERDGTCVDRSGERRSLCKAVEGLVSRSREWVFARVREFAELCPTDRHTDPTFDSPAARAVAVFRLLEVANAGGVLVSDLLPEGLTLGAPAWVPGDDPADAAPYLAKCEAWMQLARLAEPGSGSPSNGKVAPKKKRKRKSPLNRPLRPLTNVETHTLEVVARHRQNFAAAAAELDKDAKTVRENYKRAMSKMTRALGRTSRNVDAGQMPENRRGQPSISDGRG